MNDVKFYFYKAEYELDKSLFDEDSLKNYLENGLEIKKHLYRVGDHKGFLDKKSDNVFVFQKFRKDFNPTIKDEITGKTRSVELSESEYFIEENFLFWDFDNNIIVFQKNYNGFTAAAFESYIKQLLNNKFKDDLFLLKPILSKDGYEKLLNSNIVKSFEFTVSKPSVKLMRELGLNANDVMKIDNENLGKIELKITSVKNRGLFSGEAFKSFIGNKDNFSKIKIKASDSYLNAGNTIDLLEEVYTVSRNIRQNNKFQRNIDPEDIKMSIEDIYEKHIQEVLKLT